MVKARAKIRGGTIRARVKRAGSDVWEDHGVIARVKTKRPNIFQRIVAFLRRMV